MFLCLAACGGNNASSSDVSDDTLALTSAFDLSQFVPQDTQISLGENLPTFFVSGELIMQEVPESVQKEDGMEVHLANYDNSQQLTICRFPGSGSLKKSAEDFLKKYGYTEADITSAYKELNSFFDQQIKCGNFGLCESNHESTYDIDAYMFEDGEKVVLVEFWTIK